MNRAGLLLFALACVLLAAVVAFLAYEVDVTPECLLWGRVEPPPGLSPLAFYDHAWCWSERRAR